MHPNRLNEFCLRLITASIFLILFTPLLIVNHSLFPFIFPRTILFRVLVEISLVAYAFLAVRDPSYRLRRSPMLLIFGAFLIVMIIASAVGVNPHHSWWSSFERSEGILTWIHLFGFAVLLLGVFRKQAEWHTLLKLSILAGFLQSLYALGELFHLHFALDIGGERISGSIGNASFLATYLIFMIFIAAYLMVYETKKSMQAWYALTISINLVLLWGTETRGAVLALIIGGMITVSILAIRQRKKMAIGTIVAVLVLLIGSYCTLVANRQASWVTNNAMLSRIATITTFDITTQNRIIVWAAGARAIAERPLLGWGWENFAVAFNAHFDPAITRDIGSNPWYDRAHNMIVEVGVATGMAGLILYLALFVWAVVSLVPRRKREEETTGTTILLGLLIAYAIQNLFVFDTINSLIVIVLLLAFIQFRVMPVAPAAPRIKKKPLDLRVLAAVLIPLMLVVMYWINVRPAIASFYILKAVSSDKEHIPAVQEDFATVFQFSHPADYEARYALEQYTRNRLVAEGSNPSPELRTLTTFTIKAMQDCIAASPTTVQSYILLSELYLAANSIDSTYMTAAVTTAQEALQQAPQRYQVYTLLGRLAIQQGNASQAIDYFSQAIALNPAFAESHWNLAVAYILSGNETAASTELDEAERLGFAVYDEKNLDKLRLPFLD